MSWSRASHPGRAFFTPGILQVHNNKIQKKTKTTRYTATITQFDIITACSPTWPCPTKHCQPLYLVSQSTEHSCGDPDRCCLLPSLSIPAQWTEQPINCHSNNWDKNASHLRQRLYNMHTISFYDWLDKTLAQLVKPNSTMESKMTTMCFIREKLTETWQQNSSAWSAQNESTKQANCHMSSLSDDQVL